jgi:hypothetical protein
VPRLDQSLETIEQALNVSQVQTGRRFIQNVEIVAAAPHLAQLSRKLHALRFTAGENCRRVTEFQIAQTEFVQDFELPHYRALILKDTNAFLDREL